LQHPRSRFYYDLMQSPERERPKSSSEREPAMGFLVLFIVAIGTTVLAVGAATGILHLLFQLMESASLPQNVVAAEVRSGASPVHVQTAD
jgi:hypothetical protein